jgi:prophage tail gpP-like protein
VTGQIQGMDAMDAEDINIEAVLTDSTFPFKKPYVVKIEHDGMDPKNYGRLIMDGMKFASWCLEDKVYDHSQNGRNYQVNAVYHVKDEVLGVNADLLCYGRTFEMGKDGVFTTLRLSKLGVMPTL